jgi:hypothetical protein
MMHILIFLTQATDARSGYDIDTAATVDIRFDHVALKLGPMVKKTNNLQ